MSAAMTTHATTFVPVPPPQPSSRKIVAVASVAMIARNVSQPMEMSQLNTPGSFWPTTPNGARLSTIVGADPRLPATATSPHATNETTTPTTATSAACTRDSPNPSTYVPYEMPNTDTLAANHGQNRSAGRAVRSDSSTISMPVTSMPALRTASSSLMRPPFSRSPAQRRTAAEDAPRTTPRPGPGPNRDQGRSSGPGAERPRLPSLLTLPPHRGDVPAVFPKGSP